MMTGVCEVGAHTKNKNPTGRIESHTHIGYGFLAYRASAYPHRGK